MVLETKAKRCLCCLVRFEVPFLDEVSENCHLFYDTSSKVYCYYDWNDQGEYEDVVKYVLSNNYELGVENENTDGDTALRLLGQLADGHFIPVGELYRCPNCDSTNQMCNSKGTKTITIEKMSFHQCDKLTQEARIQLLSEKVKLGWEEE